MTEIPDLGALFRPPQPDAEQAAYMRAVEDWQKRETLARMALVARLAPILCSCRKWYSWNEPLPPQAECSIHGMLLAHPYTGQPVLPGMAVDSPAFTPLVRCPSCGGDPEKMPDCDKCQGSGTVWENPKK